MYISGDQIPILVFHKILYTCLQAQIPLHETLHI